MFVAWGAVVVGGLLDGWIGIRPALSPVHSEDIARAEAWLQDHATPSDRLVHSPLFAPESLRAFGDRAIGPSVPSTGRRWLVVDDVRAPMLVPEVERERIEVSGPVIIRIFTPDAALGSDAPFDLERDLGPGVARVEQGSRNFSCDQPRLPAGFQCKGQKEWVYVAPVSLTIGGRERQCVWAHPVAGKALVFELPAVAADRIVLGAGLSDSATSASDGATVRVEARQGARSLGAVVVPNRKGWREQTLEIASNEAVELRITAPRDGMRHLCIDATLEEAP